MQAGRSADARATRSGESPTRRHRFVLRASVLLIFATLIFATSAGCVATPNREGFPVSLRTAREFRKEELTVVRETPHLVFRHAPWHGVSDRDLALAEDFVVETASRLGVDPPAKTLYLIVDDEWMRERVGHRRHAEAIPRPGLARVRGFGMHEADRLASASHAIEADSAGDVPYDAIVLSSTATNLHELTHVVCGELLSPEDYAYRSPLVFEGLAVAWDGRSAEQAVERFAALWIEAGPLWPSDVVLGFPPIGADPQRVDLAYEVSGSFVRSLLARHGLEPVVDLLRTARKDTFHEVFEAVFGETLEEAESAWSAGLGRDFGADP